MYRNGYGFHQHGRRNSYPREVIIDFLSKNPKQHYSAKEIYEHLLQSGTYIGIASVYRNLELLSNLNIIKKYNFDNDELKYQFNDQTNNHHHIVCPNKIIDFTLSDTTKSVIETLKKTLESEHHIQINDYELKFFATPKDE